MRMSRLFGKTLRNAPAEAETPNHQLMLRAGLVQQLAAGIYSYLPTGWKVMRKIEQIIREEMDRAGGQEIVMPVVQPAELWELSGRARTMHDVLFHLKDRRERDLVLGPTHEEVIVDLFKKQVQSYRDMPLMVYQIQTKLRDEARPRGGLMRVREFTMKDAYSFDESWEKLDDSYDAAREAYVRIFERCGVPTVPVQADSGAIGGKDSEEFMFIADSGEDTVLFCRTATTPPTTRRPDTGSGELPPEEPLPLEEVATPGQKTIDDLVKFLGVPHDEDAEGRLLRGRRRARVRRHPRRPRGERGQARERAQGYDGRDARRRRASASTASSPVRRRPSASRTSAPSPMTRC